MSGKRLYRSRDDRMIAGVCGGFGEYFNIDPTIVRLILLFLMLWGGGGILVYLLAWIVIPEQPLGVKSSVVPADQETEKPVQAETASDAEGPASETEETPVPDTE